MTTATLDGPQAAARDSRDLQVTQAHVVSSEWIKFRSLRSTKWTLAASIAMTVGLGLLFAAVTVARWTPANRAGFDPVGLSLQGTFLAQLAIGVLGILLITGEYATGMIRATISAVPRRLPVLWAKLGVFGVVAAGASVTAALAAFLGAQAILATKHAGASLADPGVLRVVLGAGLYLTVVGLLGMALGFIIRNTAGAITTLFGILLILPVLGRVLPADWARHVVPYLPSNAGQAVMQLHADPNTLAPWTGLGLFAGYAAVAVMVAAVLLRRRDA
jgi:ABC-2 type transport system permease protein